MAMTTDYVPIKHLRANGGPIGEAIGRLVDATYQEGILDPKTVELIYIAVHSATNFPRGIVAHLGRAKAAGCSRQDIINAMMIASVNGGITGAVHALPQVIEAMDKEEIT